MSTWALIFISGDWEKPSRLHQWHENVLLLHLTQDYLTKTKRNKLNANIKPLYKMIKIDRKGRRNGEEQVGGVFIHSFTDIEALSGALGAETPLTRLVSLHSLLKMQAREMQAFPGSQPLRSTTRNMFIRKEFTYSRIYLTCLRDDTSRFRIRRSRRKSRCRPAENSGFLAISRATPFQRRYPQGLLS